MLPKYRRPTHPGEILLHEFMEPMKLTQSQLAKHLKLTQPKISALIKGKIAVTPRTAVLLGKAFVTTPEFWMNLQKNVELWDAMQEKINIRPIRSAA